MQSVTDNVTAKLRRNSLEFTLDEEGMESNSDEDEDMEERPKKKVTMKKKTEETPKSEENEDDVAYL